MAISRMQFKDELQHNQVPPPEAIARPFEDAIRARAQSPAAQHEGTPEHFMAGLERLSASQDVIHIIAGHAAPLPDGALACKVLDTFATGDYNAKHALQTFHCMDEANQKQYLRHLSASSAERLFTTPLTPQTREDIRGGRTSLVESLRDFTAACRITVERERHGYMNHDVFPASAINGMVNPDNSDEALFEHCSFVRDFPNLTALFTFAARAAIIDHMSTIGAIQCLTKLQPVVGSAVDELRTELVQKMLVGLPDLPFEERTAALCVAIQQSYKQTHFSSNAALAAARPIVFQHLGDAHTTGRDADVFALTAAVHRSKCFTPNSDGVLACYSAVPLPVHIAEAEVLMRDAAYPSDTMMVPVPPDLEVAALLPLPAAKLAAMRLYIYRSRGQRVQQKMVNALKRSWKALPQEHDGSLMTLTARVLHRRLTTETDPEILRTSSFVIQAYEQLRLRWHTASADEQRQIVADTFAYVASCFFDLDAHRADWEPLIDAAAAQPFRVASRPATCDGYAFVRALRAAAKQTFGVKYTYLLKTALRALSSADEATKYRAISLLSVDARTMNNLNRAAFELTLFDHVDKDPETWAQSALPLLLKRIAKITLDTTQQARLLELTNLHLVDEDHAAGLARFAAYGSPSPTQTQVIESSFLATLGALTCPKRTPIAQGVTRSKLATVLTNRFGSTSAHMQEAAAPLVLPLRSIRDLELVLCSGRMPQLGHENFWQMCLNHFDKLPAELRERVGLCSQIGIATIPPRLFQPVFDRVGGRFPYQCALGLVGSNRYDERVPYIIQRLVQAPHVATDIGRTELAVELLERHAATPFLPNAAALRLWEYLATVPITKPNVALPDGYADLLAQHFARIPARLQAPLAERTLAHLSESARTTAIGEAASALACIDHLLARLDLLDYRRRGDLIALAVPLCSRLSPAGNDAIRDDIATRPDNAAVRQRYYPSLAVRLAAQRRATAVAAASPEVEAAATTAVKAVEAARSARLRNGQGEHSDPDESAYLRSRQQQSLRAIQDLVKACSRDGSDDAVLTQTFARFLSAQLKMGAQAAANMQAGRISLESFITDEVLRDALKLEQAASHDDPTAMRALADQLHACNAEEEAAQWRFLAQRAAAVSEAAPTQSLATPPPPTESVPPAPEISAFTRAALAPNAHLNAAAYVAKLEAAFAERDYAGTRKLAAFYEEDPVYRNPPLARYYSLNAAVMPRFPEAVAESGDITPNEIAAGGIALYCAQQERYVGAGIIL